MVDGSEDGEWNRQMQKWKNMGLVSRNSKGSVLTKEDISK
jgi:hypothetical protein